MSWYIILFIVMLGVIVGMEFWFEKKEKGMEEMIRRQQKKLDEQRAINEKYKDVNEKLKRQIIKQNETIIWLSENRQREE